LPELHDRLRHSLEHGTASDRFEVQQVFPVIGERVFLLSVKPFKRSATSASMILLDIEDITDRRRADIALRESRERFEDITLSSADWIWEVDANGVYTYASGNVSKILGYSSEELIGKTPFDMMLEDDAERVSKLFGSIAAEKKPINDLENWNLSRDGNRVCLLTNGVPILGSHGELLGYRGVDKDITDRKKVEQELRRSEALFSEIFSMSPVACAVSSLTDGHLIELNEAFVTLTGYQRAEAIGKTTRDLHIWHNSDVRATVVKTLQDGGIVKNLEIDVRDKSGQIHNCLFSANIIQYNGKFHILSMAIDITDHKTSERELADYNRRLKETNHQLKMKQQELEEFTYTVSHDLKAPLVSIQGFASLLREKTRGRLGKEEVKYLSRIIANGEDMEGLLGDLLQLSRIGRIEEEYELVDIESMVSDIIHSFSSTMQSGICLSEKLR
jgi:PAS domain S-box-containing protein